MECQLTKIRVFKPRQIMNCEGAIARYKGDEKVNVYILEELEKRVFRVAELDSFIFYTIADGQKCSRKNM